MATIREYRAEDEAAAATLKLELRPGAAYVAVDGGVVRGGYQVARERFVVGSDELDVQRLELPPVEVEGAVGSELVDDAQRRFPLLFCLGPGARHRPLLESRGWKLVDVRFFFRVS